MKVFVFVVVFVFVGDLLGQQAFEFNISSNSTVEEITISPQDTIRVFNGASGGNWTLDFSTDYGGSNSYFLNLERDYYGWNGSYFEKTINPSYAGRTIAYRFTDSDDNSKKLLVIINVLNTTSVINHLSNSVKVTPNPCIDILNVEGSWESIKMINLSGRVIKEWKGGLQNQLLLNGIASGYYIVVIDKESPIRIVKY